MDKRNFATIGVGIVLTLIVTGCGGSATPAVQLEPTIAVTTGSPIATLDPNLSTPASIATIATAPAASDTGASLTVACTKLNLNTLTEDQLMQTIPNFSSRMVREFFEYRPYVSIQQFRREIGKYVDAAQVADYEQYVYVPIVPNDADADTLTQIPGVTPEIAAELIAARPFTNNIAFLAALGRQVTADQVVTASCYLAQ